MSFRAKPHHARVYANCSRWQLRLFPSLLYWLKYLANEEVVTLRHRVPRYRFALLD